MRFYFNLPGRVTKVKITLTEERDGELVQEKSYNFTKEQFKAFLNDHQRAAYINALVGADWTNPEDVRKSKKEMRAKRKAKKEKRYPWGVGVESIVKELTEGDAVQEKVEEGGNE